MPEAHEPTDSSSVGAVRLTLVGRRDCHLCEVARDEIARVAELAGVGWQELDVDSDPALAEEYWDRVPVILLDGREHGYWRVEADRLLAALNGGHPGASHD
jgi:hypothetical protein